MKFYRFRQFYLIQETNENKAIKTKTNLKDILIISTTYKTNQKKRYQLLVF